MKKIFLFLSIAAILAFTTCTKERGNGRITTPEKITEVRTNCDFAVRDVDSTTDADLNIVTIFNQSDTTEIMNVLCSKGRKLAINDRVRLMQVEYSLNNRLQRSILAIKVQK